MGKLNSHDNLMSHKLSVFIAKCLSITSLLRAFMLLSDASSIGGTHATAKGQVMNVTFKKLSFVQAKKSMWSVSAVYSSQNTELLPITQFHLPASSVWYLCVVVFLRFSIHLLLKRMSTSPRMLSGLNWPLSALILCFSFLRFASSCHICSLWSDATIVYR